MNAVAVAVLAAQSFPAATTVGPVLFTLLDSNNNPVTTQSVTAAAGDTSATATFPDVPAGTYTVSAVRQDASGAMLGTSVVSAPITISAPSTISITVPASVSVTQS